VRSCGDFLLMPKLTCIEKVAEAIHGCFFLLLILSFILGAISLIVGFIMYLSNLLS
jgi:hypothetical protein